jgi:EmrB/QacA subfamily drug resistance transporter
VTIARPRATVPLTRYRKWVTFGVIMGLFLSAFEATVVVAAMPTVISHLGGLEVYAWVYSIYFLTATVTVPLWGRFSDLFGRRHFYIAGLALFTLGSIFCGISTSMPQLIASRAVQGFGAGALVPLGMTIIGDLYSLEERGRVQGLFSGVWGLSSLMGPLMGGLITDTLSWRWVFFINVPFGLLAGVIIGAFLRDPEVDKQRRVDVLGAVLLSIGLILFLLGLDSIGKGQVSARPGIMLGIALVLILLFIRVEVRHRDPILPLFLFGDRIFSAAILNGLLTGMALFGAITFVPLFVQGVLGTGATEAGWALMPLTLAWVFWSIISGRLIMLVGYRRLVTAGMLCLCLGFWLLSTAGADVSITRLVTAMALLGSGMGLSMVSLLIAVQNRVPRELLGAATSAASFFRQVGASVGIALMGTVMTNRLLAGLSELQADADSQIGRLLARPDAILDPLARNRLPPAVLQSLQGVLESALSNVFQVGFLISILALACALLIPPGSARQHARKEE